MKNLISTSVVLPERGSVHHCAELLEVVHNIGFLPLLSSGVVGFSAEELVDDTCRYHTLPDGGWEWPLWEWKGAMITEGDCVYGKFFGGKAGFVSLRWWPDLCNYRRSANPAPEPDSVEEAIVEVLRQEGAMITRDLRRMCGFDGAGMRSRFDSHVTRLQFACRVVVQDFVYPTDRHGHRYGWGWALLTVPERLYGKESCQCQRTPRQSFDAVYGHLSKLLPQASEKQIIKLLQ